MWYREDSSLEAEARDQAEEEQRSDNPKEEEERNFILQLFKRSLYCFVRPTKN
jgi:hypothetical protein